VWKESSPIKLYSRNIVKLFFNVERGQIIFFNVERSQIILFNVERGQIILFNVERGQIILFNIERGQIILFYEKGRKWCFYICIIYWYR